MEVRRPMLHKIPGDLMPLAKRDKYVQDLTTLSRPELLEIKERESKLLKNKVHINRLPDKGKRIQDFYDKVLAELERRANVEEAAALFSELNIVETGKDTLNKLEWCGHLSGKGVDELADPTEDVLDSDDEIQMDPLKIIAKATMHERRTKVIPPEPTLITSEDLEEIKSFEISAASSDSGISSGNDSRVLNIVSTDETKDKEETVQAEIVAIDLGEKLPKLKPKLEEVLREKSDRNGSPMVDSHSSTPTPEDIEQHVRYVVEKTEVLPPPTREKFKPYKTTVTNVHDPEKERLRKRGKHWEVTAATPPPIQHNGAQMLTLMDSVEIQINYLAKIKKLQEKQAAERLAAKLERLGNRKLELPNVEELKTKSSFTTYRQNQSQIEGTLHYNDDDEVHDPLDEEKAAGTITYSYSE